MRNRISLIVIAALLLVAIVPVQANDRHKHNRHRRHQVAHINAANRHGYEAGKAIAAYAAKTYGAVVRWSACPSGRCK